MAEGAHYFRSGNHSRYSFTCRRRSEVGGSDLAYKICVVRSLVVGKIPTNSTVEMRIEEAGFLCRIRQEYVFFENRVQPTRSGPWRTDDEECRKK